MKVSKSVKIDENILRKVALVSKEMGTSVHSYLVDSISKNVIKDYADLRLEDKYDRMHNYFIEGDTCEKEGWYGEYLTITNGDMLTALVGYPASRQKLAASGVMSSNIEGASEDFKAMVTEGVRNNVSTYKFSGNVQYVKQGELFPKLIDDSKARMFIYLNA